MEEYLREISGLDSMSALQNLDVFLENLRWSKFSNHLQAEVTPGKLPVFGFANSLPYGLEGSKGFRNFSTLVFGYLEFKII